jgi:CubicO group peptidase (beta-lactamase class C family)
MAHLYCKALALQLALSTDLLVTNYGSLFLLRSAPPELYLAPHPYYGWGMKFTGCSLGLALATSLLLATSISQAAETYPATDWETGTPESVGIDNAKLKAFSDYVFTKTPNRASDGLLVIRHGKLVYEKYDSGYSREMRHISWSMAKSFTTVLLGIAESEGILSRNSKVADVFPYPTTSEAERTRRDSITVYNLLTMTSGFDWVEDYSKKSPLNSDVTQMLYLNPHKDMAAYVASRPARYVPGDRFYYSTGDMTLAMGVLKYHLSKQAYDFYPKTRLFDRIGMKNVVFEQDSSGTFGGGSYVYATPRDFARFGYLLLHGGKWNDDQVVPSEWLGQIRTLSPGLATGNGPTDEKSVYGMGFWLNIPAPKHGIAKPYPDAPSDLFFALGHNGQYIAVYPSLDLVIVRLAHDTNDPALDRNRFFSEAANLVAPAETIPFTPAPRAALVSSSEDRLTLPTAPDYEKKHTSLINFTKLIASVRAKDYCSCRYVVGQTDVFCTALVKNGFSTIFKAPNDAKRSVVFGLAPPVAARVTSEDFGCSFD